MLWYETVIYHAHLLLKNFNVASDTTCIFTHTHRQTTHTFRQEPLQREVWGQTVVNLQRHKGARFHIWKVTRHSACLCDAQTTLHAQRWMDKSMCMNLDVYKHYSFYSWVFQTDNLNSVSSICDVTGPLSRSLSHTQCILKTQVSGVIEDVVADSQRSCREVRFQWLHQTRMSGLVSSGRRRERFEWQQTAEPAGTVQSALVSDINHVSSWMLGSTAPQAHFDDGWCLKLQRTDPAYICFAGFWNKK